MDDQKRIERKPENRETNTQVPNQNLTKALQILDAFSAKRPEWGIRELGRELGINPTSVFRLVKTLSEAGYLEKNANNQTYSLGPKVVKLASLYMHVNPLSTLARKVFESYTDRFQYNYYLGNLVRNEVIYLAVLDGKGPIKVAIEPGRTVAIHTTALGKVLLAFTSDDFIRQYLRETQLVQATPRSIVDPKKLWEQICEIRQQSYAINDGEQYEEIGSVAVPVFDATGHVSMAVSLAYPLHLLSEKSLQLEELISLANEVAREIELRTGSIHFERSELH
jgi:IclR family acetate operon transcriptional repressor